MFNFPQFFPGGKRKTSPETTTKLKEKNIFVLLKFARRIIRFSFVEKKAFCLSLLFNKFLIKFSTNFIKRGCFFLCMFVVQLQLPQNKYSIKNGELVRMWKIIHHFEWKSVSRKNAV
jgi:hypothetical protein